MSGPLESDVEDEVIAWAENRGWIARFMSYRGRRGCRDVDFYGFGRIVLVEFKRPHGGSLSANQERERERLAKVGVTVHVISTVEDGVKLLRGFM